ncbi:MAG: hypothetical protein RLZZ156_2580 [Deinococcota bacterium]|jgi:hypothetical protein
MNAIPTLSHLELFAMRERLKSRLREFGIRAQLPKLELPKLAALAELLENHVQSDIFGRRWLKSVLLSLVLLLEQWFETPQNTLENVSETRDTDMPRLQGELPVGNLVLLGHHARVLWCCFRN